MGSEVVVHRLSCSVACGIFLEQNSCLLYHEGNPASLIGGCSVSPGYGAKGTQMDHYACDPLPVAPAHLVKVDY